MKTPVPFTALSAVVALLAASPARAADPACPFGVNAHQASNEALDLAAAAAISWVRFDLNWLQFEPSQGNYAWAEADRFVDHAHSLGLQIFMTAAYSPMWAVGVPCNDADPNDLNHCLNAPPDTAAWTSFVTAAVSRYGDRVKAWGMWNEPNLSQFFRGTRQQYVDGILVPGSAAVHAACSDCLVLGPELSNLRSANWDGDEGECYPVVGCRYNAWEYSLREIMKAAGGSIDVITHHKYADDGVGMWTGLADGVFEGPVEVNHGLKEILDQVAPGKPVWITEFGWESEPFGNNTNTVAADQLTKAWKGFAAVREGTQPAVQNQPWPELQKMFWYDLHDDPSGYSWGLLDANLGKKAPYDAYAQVISSWGPCSGSAGAAAGGSSGSADAGGFPDSGVGGQSAPGAGGMSGNAGAAGGGLAGSAGTAAGASGGTPADTDSGTSTEDGGCGCGVPGSAPSSSIALMTVLAWVMRRRRS